MSTTKDNVEAISVFYEQVLLELTAKVGENYAFGLGFSNATKILNTNHDLINTYDIKEEYDDHESYLCGALIVSKLNSILKIIEDC